MSLTDFPDADESSLISDNDTASVSEAHQQTLDQRWSDYRDGKVTRISLKELEDRLTKHRPV